VITRVEGRVSRANHVPIQSGGRPTSAQMGDLIHARTRYEKQQALVIKLDERKILHGR